MPHLSRCSVVCFQVMPLLLLNSSTHTHTFHRLNGLLCDERENIHCLLKSCSPSSSSSRLDSAPNHHKGNKRSRSLMTKVQSEPLFVIRQFFCLAVFMASTPSHSHSERSIKFSWRTHVNIMWDFRSHQHLDMGAYHEDIRNGR
jgi:hypothetical protein